MKDDRSIQLLLAKGRLSGAERDRILDDVLDAATPRRARRWLVRLAAGLVPAAAAAAVILVVVARRPAGLDDAPGMRPKGVAGAAVLLQARCPGRAPGQCARGDRLMFEVDGAAQGGLLAAYAQRSDGDRVWYFPTAAGHLATVEATPGHAVVGEGVRLGSEHAPGSYQLHLFVLEQAVDRAALLDGRARPRATAVLPLQVLP